MTEKQPHSRAYHRYFEGCAENESIGPDGKKRIERVYIGSYYQLDAPRSRRYLRGATYVALYVLACVLFILAGVQDTVINRVWYVAAPEAISVFMLFRLFLPVFYYLTAPHVMEVRAYRDSSKSLIRISLIAAIALGMTAVAALAGVMMTTAAPGWSTLAIPCRLLAAGILLLCLRRLEKSAVYTVLPPKNQRPDESIVI